MSEETLVAILEDCPELVYYPTDISKTVLKGCQGSHLLQGLLTETHSLTAK